jgi:hypothetical protein
VASAIPLKVDGIRLAPNAIYFDTQWGIFC